MPLFLPHFNLQPYNTFNVPVSAAYYVSVTSDTELYEALAFAAQNNLPLLILGGGSNIILCDDFPGLVIHMRLLGKTLVAENNEHVWLKVAAGENWQKLIEYCLDFHYWGLENLSLIPGSVGAAPIQNIGAYGVELKDVFEELCAIEIASGMTVTFTKEHCDFGYRDSVFKGRLKDQYVITSVTFKLARTPNLTLSYPALKTALIGCENITPLMVSQTIADIRRSKLPDPSQLPNAGSFFKNPVISIEQYHALHQLHPDLTAFPVDDGNVKVAAAWLIDHAGWRGYRDGPVAVHAEQALVITNPGGARGDVILALAQKIQTSVQAAYGITLEPEPRIYPEI